MKTAKTLILLVSLIGVCSSVFTQTENPEVLNIYREANDMFLRGNDAAGTDPSKARDYYGKAAFYFESLYLKHGIKNGKLFYNTGNAYYRAGNLGKSVLYYKNAMRYIPGDSNLKKNLDFVRSQRVDQITEQEERKILKTVFFWHYDIPANLKLSVFIATFVLIWVLASLLLLFRKKLIHWLMVITIVVSAVFFASYAIDLISHIQNREGVILADSIVARKGDGITYQPSFNEPLHEGTEFVLVEKRRDWMNIELLDGKRCWIPEKSAALVL